MYEKFNRLPYPTALEVARKYGIERTGVLVTDGFKVSNTGFTIEDLSVLPEDALDEYFPSEEIEVVDSVEEVVPYEGKLKRDGTPDRRGWNLRKETV